MKLSIKNLVIGAIVLGITISGISIFAAPGDENDPIISLSYINEKLKPKLNAYIDEKVIKVEAENGEKFVVISVNKGEKFYADEGTEFILRMGSGKIIATQKGGIANVTEGIDLPNGAAVPANCLLIVPVDDGRGFEATADVLVMVKGGYEIK